MLGTHMRPLLVFSLFINLLMLTGPLFMLQIYDRVLVSGSLPTLGVLLLLVIGLYAIMGVLEVARGTLMVHAFGAMDARLSSPAFLASLERSRALQPEAAAQPLRDLERVRQFVVSPAALAFFDLPWLPLFLVAVALIHPLLGLLGLVGAGALFAIALWASAASRPGLRAVQEGAAMRDARIGSATRNHDAVAGLHMTDALNTRFGHDHAAYHRSQRRLGETLAVGGSVLKVSRLLIQSLVLALGASLAIAGHISAGAIIAASIVVARALQPIEGVVQNWRGVTAAWSAYTRLKPLIAGIDDDAPSRISLPAPRKTVQVDDISVGPPGADHATIHDIGLRCAAGEAIGIVGHSGSGKSTLARALVGVWPVLGGEVRLDGAALEQWPARDLARHIGFLPQDVELFSGSVAQNIARFRDEGDAPVIAAARAAGCHGLITALPDGYNTAVGANGRAVSAGQRQRIALARALYGDPFLIVLDEPNSNLDGEGDAALARAIHAAKERGAVVVVIAHRPSALQAVDRLCLLEDGRLTQDGPRDAVLRAIMSRATGRRVDVPSSGGGA